MIGIIILLGIIEAIISYRYVSKSSGKNINAIDYFFWNCLFCTLWLLGYMCVQLGLSTDPLDKIQKTDIVPILLCMLLAGLTGSVYNLSALKALEYGNKGLSSAISNTALAFSTIFFVVFWDNTISDFGAIGIIMMLISVCFMGYTGKNKNKTNATWLGFCICALIFNTMAIILSTAPSQYNMRDEIGLRGPAIMGFLVLFAFFIKRYKHIQTNKAAVKIAVVNSILAAIVQMASYPLMDKLAENKIAYVFTPVKLVTSLVFFAMITSIRFKEKPGRVQAIGMVMCVAGILCFLC